MSSSERNEERNFILECIQVYRDHSALWEIKSDDYMDRNKKNHDIYQSHLWYFNEMHFLRDQETPAKSRSTLQILPPPKVENTSNVDDQIDEITETMGEV